MKILIAIIILSFTLPSFAYTPVFHCVGTEPFWSINVSETEKLVRFRTPETYMALKLLSKRVANGSSSNGAFIVKTKYSSLTVAPAECSDGMSDNIYTHTAVFDMGRNQLYFGCCDID